MSVPTYTDEFRAKLEVACKEVSRQYMEAIEAEIERMLTRWPEGYPSPVLVFDKRLNLLGLGVNTEIGGVQEIVVYAYVKEPEE